MASKYAQYKDKFPKLQLDPSDSHDQKVLAKLQELVASGMERKEVTEKFKEMRFEKEAKEAELKSLGIDLKAHELWMIEFFEDENVTSIRDVEGFTFREQPEPYCTVTDKPTFDQWAEGSGWKDLYTINHNTLNAGVKALIVENQPAPPGVSVWMKNKVVMTKPK